MLWTEVLAPIKNAPYYKELWRNVELEYEHHLCFPPKDLIFKALELTAFEDVKVVILGQDPYHDTNQANGLCFSVSDQVPAPPSLKNIFKELNDDLGVVKNTNQLDSWAKQGVLLLNSSLTVRAHSANSHKNLGWGKFTDFIIEAVSKHKENVVFVLWGGFAQKKKVLIDGTKHYIICSAHPSPLSSYRGFFGSKPFSSINRYLHEHGKSEIDW